MVKIFQLIEYLNLILFQTILSIKHTKIFQNDKILGDNKIFSPSEEMKGLQVVIYCFISATLPRISSDLADTQQRNLLSDRKRNERHGFTGQ